jgi:hypothetical protein
MNIRKIKQITKKQALIGTAGLLLVSGSALALSNPSTSGADEEPPIVKQVNDHEGRITSLESKTDATNEKVAQNTADINNVRTQVGGTSNSTGGSSSTPQSAPSGSDSTPAPQDNHVQPPVTVVDPWTIKDVQTTYRTTEDGYTTHTCVYTTENGKQKTIDYGPTGVCHVTGEILPYTERPR